MSSRCAYHLLNQHYLRLNERPNEPTEPLINSLLITRALSVHVRGQSTGYRIPKSLCTMQTIVRHVVSDQISDRLWSRLRQLNRVLCTAQTGRPPLKWQVAYRHNYVLARPSIMDYSHEVLHPNSLEAIPMNLVEIHGIPPRFLR